MKKILALLLLLSMLLTLIGCGKPSKSFINGENLENFSIVYSPDDTDYARRAAEYIKNEICSRTGLDLPIVKDTEPESQYEIVVGNTSRGISKRLDAQTEGLEFAILAEESKIALEGELFIIAAAAYYFIDTYVPYDDFSAEIPEAVSVHTPIVKEAKNYIMLIGDGMGVHQTQIFDYLENNVEYGDGEDIFYGYYLPYMGYSRTESLSGVTDSAAGGTALSCGIKTFNKYIGRDAELNDVKSITELAHELGMAAGVMSTENDTGATPSSFSAHADSRNSSADIIKSQAEAKQKYGTKIDCGYDYYTARYMAVIENHITDMLTDLSKDEDGFFLMYEEAHIDKHCHNNDLDSTFNAMVRFNQAIGRFMEYAFYNPDTFILITADHETGDLYPDENGVLQYHHDDHTAKNVPVFAYGYGADIFDGVEMENIQIAHTIASFMGEDNFGDQSVYQRLNK